MRSPLLLPINVSVCELFLFGGAPVEFFEFQSSTNLGFWHTNATFEPFDACGTIYLLRTCDFANTPPTEIYRTRPLPQNRFVIMSSIEVRIVRGHGRV